MTEYVKLEDVPERKIKYSYPWPEIEAIPPGHALRVATLADFTNKRDITRYGLSLRSLISRGRKGGQGLYVMQRGEEVWVGRRNSQKEEQKR